MWIVERERDVPRQSTPLLVDVGHGRRKIRGVGREVVQLEFTGGIVARGDAAELLRAAGLLDGERAEVGAVAPVGRRRLADVCDAVVAEFEVAAGVASADLLDFFRQLEGVGAVEEGP